MVDLFQNNRLKNRKVFFAVIILIVTSYLVMFPEVGGDFSVMLSWSYLTIGGLSSMLLLVGFNRTKQFFRRMEKGSWKWVLLSIVLGMIVSILFVQIGYFFNLTMAENAAFEGVSDTSLPLWIHIISAITTFVSLVGEEIITAAMAIIVYSYAEKSFDSRMSWILAALISAVLFGLMHYGVYDGNIFQCVFVIGIGRLPFTYAWRKTGSLWGGILAHVIYDFILFGILYVI
ncbi:CPBP family intramembrane metalloprotease [Enterococcus faecalis]|nr:CPBP family intramembrane metalloprotease [Enterococcus faecalis]